MAATARPTIREVRHASDPAVTPAHRLVHRSFAPSESVRRAEWLNVLREGEERLWADLRWHLLVAELGGEVVGVATGTYLGNVNIGVIGYLAVVRGARGVGVGPALRARLCSRFRRDARQIGRGPLQAIVGEIRRDNPWLGTLIRRHRVLALDFKYAQPRLRPGERPVPLVLYYESLDRPRRRLPSRRIKQLLYTIWRRTYRIAQPLSDPIFRRMLAELDRTRSIGALSPDALPSRPPSRDRA